MTLPAALVHRELPAAGAARQLVDGGLSVLPSAFAVAPNQFDQVFYRSRDPHPDDIRALRMVSPKSDIHGYLWLSWDPGEPWAPRQRWVLDELIDPKLQIEINGEWGFALDAAILEELEGPHPRSSGHMCHWDVPGQFQCDCRDARGRPKKTGAWRGGPCQLITLRQWQIYQEIGMFANPFWIIQGPNGGHQASYNSLEREWLRQEGLPVDPPGTGELPFAPFDGRVTRSILRHNRLLALDNDVSAYRRQQGADYAKHRKAIEKEMRRQWVAFLANQTREEADDFTEAYRKGEFDKGGTDVDWEKVDELATADFIETGRTASAAVYAKALL